MLTWDDFLYEFTNNYIPEAYKDDKRREFFLNSKQMTMIAVDYEVKFNQLSRYSLFLVAIDTNKC